MGIARIGLAWRQCCKALRSGARAALGGWMGSGECRVRGRNGRFGRQVRRAGKGLPTGRRIVALPCPISAPTTTLPLSLIRHPIKGVPQPGQPGGLGAVAGGERVAEEGASVAGGPRARGGGGIPGGAAGPPGGGVVSRIVSRGDSQIISAVEVKIFQVDSLLQEGVDGSEGSAGRAGRN